MASSSGSPFYQKLEWVDTLPDVIEAVEELRRQDEMAMDFKWNNLSRMGNIDILSIGTVDGKVILFDIKKIGWYRI
jgi:hypothetical protein